MPDQTSHSQVLSASLSRMGGVLLTEETLDAILDLIASLARSSIQGADAVSVTLLREQSAVTAAHTDESVIALDRVQYESGSGPCLSASKQGVVVDSPHLAEDARWPEFRTAAADWGMAAVRSAPLIVQDQSIGALNLYSKSAHGFDRSHDVVAQFARQASVIVTIAQAYTTAERLNEQLQEALRSREMIGQAKGVLMEREHCSPDEAFDILRRASQHSNRKLRDVAKEVVDSAARGSQ